MYMKFKIYFLLFLSFCLIQRAGIAQCVMCKATAEQGQAQGIGQGLNNGILYLAAIPYSVLLIFGIYFYRKHKRKLKAEKGQ